MTKAMDLKPFYTLAGRLLIACILLYGGVPANAQVDFTARQVTYNSCLWLGGERAVVVGNYGSMLITTDSCKTWETIATPTLRHLRSVNAGELGELFAVGEKGIVLRSVDGAITWREEPIAGFETVGWRNIVPLSDRLALLCGDSGIILAREGFSWRRLPTSFKNTVHNVVMGPSGELFALCSEGTVFSFRPGGQEWEPRLTGTSGLFSSLIFLSDSIAVLSGSVADRTLVLRSTDGGVNFQNVSTGEQTVAGARLSRLRDGRLVLVGMSLNRERTFVIMSSDSGRRWSSRPLSNTSRPLRATSFFANGARSGLFLGFNGTVAYTENIDAPLNSAETIGGVRNIGAPGSLQAVAQGPNGMLAAITLDQFRFSAISHDNGTSWTSPFVGVNNARSVSISRQYVYYSGVQRAMFRSPHSGDSLEQIPTFGIVSELLNQGPILFADNLRRGYFPSFDTDQRPQKNIVLRTLDGGQSWSPIEEIDKIQGNVLRYSESLPQAFGSGYQLAEPYAPHPPGTRGDTGIFVRYFDANDRVVREVNLRRRNDWFRVIDTSTAIEYSSATREYSIVVADKGAIQVTTSEFPSEVSPLYMVRFGTTFLASARLFRDAWVLALSPDLGKTWLFDTIYQPPFSQVSTLTGVLFRQRDTSLVLSIAGQDGLLLDIKLSSYPIVRDRYVSAEDASPSQPTGAGNARIEVSPSPTRWDLTVRLRDLGAVASPDIRLTLHDLTGAHVADWSNLARASISGPDATFQVSLPSEAAAGVYLLRLRCGEISVSQKVVIID